MAGPQPMPAAEVDVSPELVRRLLESQHPDLAGLPVELLANGWDNIIFRLGEHLLVRMPRRELAARLGAHEQQWLPLIAPRLPLPVPVPVRVGEPALGYPWSWSIVPFLPGRVASRRAPADPFDAAARLGEFLAALHVAASPDAPVNLNRGIPLADRAATLGGNLTALGGLVDQRAVRARWQAAVAVPSWEGPPVWLHGDLHPANILVDHGAVSGVIDFGDITSGDPAADLSVAWMLLPRDCHGAFADAYRAASQNAATDDLWARARGWALALSLAFLANSADNEEIAGIGRRTLRAVLA